MSIHFLTTKYLHEMTDKKKSGKNISEKMEKAKDEVKKATARAGEKAEEFAKEVKNKAEELKEEAKELADEAKHKAGEFKEEAKEFVDDAEQTLNEDNGKGVAIIAHITPLGWIIALIMNGSNKTELGSFYIRQSLGLFLLLFLSWIPFLGWIIGLLAIVLWFVSLVNAIGGKLKPIPLVGEYFQNWFKSL